MMNYYDIMVKVFFVMVAIAIGIASTLYFKPHNIVETAAELAIQYETGASVDLSELNAKRT